MEVFTLPETETETRTDIVTDTSGFKTDFISSLPLSVSVSASVSVNTPSLCGLSDLLLKLQVMIHFHRTTYCYLINQRRGMRTLVAQL